jgi:hypothetical protein
MVKSHDTAKEGGTSRARAEMPEKRRPMTIVELRVRADEQPLAGLDRLAKLQSWPGRIPAAEAQALLQRCSNEIERSVVGLFSESSEVSELQKSGILTALLSGKAVPAALAKRVPRRFVELQWWGEAAESIVHMGAKKFPEVVELIPELERSSKAVTLARQFRTDISDVAARKTLTRELATLLTWARGDDAKTLAAETLLFAANPPPTVKRPIIVALVKALVDKCPPALLVEAADSFQGLAGSLSALIRVATRSSLGAKSASVLIRAVAASRRADVLASPECWDDLSLMEIGQLASDDAVYRHLSGNPSWWSQRQQRELRSEGIGALMRLVDVHRKCENLIDWQKVNDYAKKSGQKMPSYPVIKVFVDEVIETALAEQDRVHKEDDKKRQTEIAETHASVEKLKAKLVEAEERYLKQVSLLREKEQAELADRTNIRVIAQGEMLRTLENVCLAAAKFVQQLTEQSASGAANDQLLTIQNSAEAMMKEIESELRKSDIETDRDGQGMIRALTRRTPRDDNGSV